MFSSFDPFGQVWGGERGGGGGGGVEDICVFWTSGEFLNEPLYGRSTSFSNLVPRDAAAQLEPFLLHGFRV